MLSVVFISLLLVPRYYCDQAGYIGAVLKIGEDSVVGQIGFETEQDDWTLKNMKIIELNDTLENVYNIPGEGHVAVPRVSMSGDEWGQLYATFRIPAVSRLAVDFSVFTSGFDPGAEISLFSNNPDLVISLTEVNTSSIQKLTNLQRLNPQNNLWNKYRTEIQPEGGLGFYKISLDTMMGVGVIALDAVVVEIVPVVGEAFNTNKGNYSSSLYSPKSNFTSVDSPETNSTSLDSLGNNSSILDSPKNNSTNSDSPGNNSTSLESLGNNSTSLDSQGNNSTLLDSPENNATSIDSPGNDSIDQDSPENLPPKPTEAAIDRTTLELVTTNKANLSIPMTNLTAGNLSSLAGGTTSMYGYSGEVVLICLAVLFILLFLGMVYKYHRLKSHMGDYRLDMGGERNQGQENQVQMSYRMDD